MPKVTRVITTDFTERSLSCRHFATCFMAMRSANPHYGLLLGVQLLFHFDRWGHRGSGQHSSGSGGLLGLSASRGLPGKPILTYPLLPSAPVPVSSHRGHQEPLQHDVIDLPAPLGAASGLLPQQLAQPHMAEAVFGCHVLALCPFATTWAAHHEDDQGRLEDVCGSPGKRWGEGLVLAGASTHRCVCVHSLVCVLG